MTDEPRETFDAPVHVPGLGREEKGPGDTGGRDRARARARVRKKAFLRAFGECGVVSAACEHVGIARSRPYKWAKDDPWFAKKFQEMGEREADILEMEARRRALEGTTKPIVQGGMVVTTVQEYSDTLMMFLLKAKRPEKYRDRVDHRHSGVPGAPIVAEVTHHVDPADYRAAVFDALREAGLGDDPEHSEDAAPPGESEPGDAPEG